MVAVVKLRPLDRPPSARRPCVGSWVGVVVACLSSLSLGACKTPFIDRGDAAGTSCSADEDAAAVDSLTYVGRGEGRDFIEILDVQVRGDTVFACSSVAGLNLWDSSAAGPPRLIAGGLAPPGFSSNGYAHCQHVGMDADNGQIAVTNRGDEIEPKPFIFVVDASDPLAPSPIGGWTGVEAIEGVAMRSGRVWATAHGDGIIVFDLVGSGLGGLVEVARFADASSDAWFPHLVDNHLLVAEGAAGLRVYDVAQPTPTLVATVPIEGSSKDLVVHDGVAYVAASSRVAAIDVSDPTQPELIGEIETQGTAVALSVGVNNTLLVAEWERVRGYDISDPRAMSLELSEVAPPKTGAPFSRVLTVAADPAKERVFVGEWNGLHLYDQAPCSIGPDIETSPDQISFPAVAPGSSDVFSLVIRNNGNRDLVVSDISSDNAALTLSSTELTIAAGEGDFVEVTFSPTSTTALDARLTLTSNDLDQGAFVLRVSGNVPGTDVGDPLPSFNLLDTEGTMWTSAALEGQVVVLAYFATF